MLPRSTARWLPLAFLALAACAPRPGGTDGLLAPRGAGGDGGAPGHGGEGGDRGCDGGCGGGSGGGGEGGDGGCDGGCGGEGGLPVCPDGAPRNACGTCGETCHEERFDDPLACLHWYPCNDGLCRGDTADSFTVCPRRQQGQHVLHVPLTGQDAIVKIDAPSGQTVWRAPSHGPLPARLQVPPDRSVWVANRGSPGSSVVHLDRDGNPICRAAVPDGAAALALDSSGDVWVASREGILRSLSGSWVGAPDPQGFPGCELLEIQGAASMWLGVAVRDMVVGDGDVLWTASNPAVRLELNTLALERIEHLHASGVVVDPAGVPWFSGDVVHALAPRGPYVDRASYERAIGIGADAVALDGAGHLHALRGSVLHELDAAGAPIGQRELPGPAVALALDGLGGMWAIGPTAWRVDGDTVTAVPVDPAAHVELRGDATGHAAGRPWGRARLLSLRFDGRPTSARFLRLDWRHVVPEGTGVRVWATHEDGHGLRPACGPVDRPPLRLDRCPALEGSGVVHLHVRLVGDDAGDRRPTVSGLRLTWTTP